MHWIYDPADPVYLDTPPHSSSNLPSKDSITPLSRARLLPFAPYFGSELLRTANPLQGKESSEHSVPLHRRLFVWFVCFGLSWAVDLAHCLSGALHYSILRESVSIPPDLVLRTGRGVLMRQEAVDDELLEGIYEISLQGSIRSGVTRAPPKGPVLSPGLRVTRSMLTRRGSPSCSTMTVVSAAWRTRMGPSAFGNSLTDRSSVPSPCPSRPPRTAARRAGEGSPRRLGRPPGPPVGIGPSCRSRPCTASELRSA